MLTKIFAHIWAKFLSIVLFIIEKMVKIKTKILSVGYWSTKFCDFHKIKYPEDGKSNNNKIKFCSEVI